MIKTLDTNCRRTCATRRGGKVLAYNFKKWMIRTPVTAPLLKMRLFAATAGVRIRECLVEKKKQTNKRPQGVAAYPRIHLLHKQLHFCFYITRGEDP